MTNPTLTLFRLVPATMLALVLAACSLSPDQTHTREDTVKERVIIDDLRAPSRQNY